MTLSCLACRASFPSSDVLRVHYQSEWHRYNLKRKLVSLPQITLEDFESKKHDAESAENAPTCELEPNKQLRCTSCSKNFQSTKSLNNHLQSAKHKEKKDLQTFKNSLSDTSQIPSTDLPEVVANNVDDTEVVELVDKAEPRGFTMNSNMDEAEDEWESEEEMEVVGEELIDEDVDLNPALCLFCTDLLESVDKNRVHMEEVHSFFIPFSELLVDLEGLISYLHEKIQSCHMCLFCGERSKYYTDSQAVRQHMSTKGHGRMAHDTTDDFLEYVEFYDDPSSADVAIDEDKLAEMISSSIHEQYELVLPSGASIGHRALLRYYKQRAPVGNLPKAKQFPRAIMQAAGSSSKSLVPLLGIRGNLNNLGPRIKELKMLQRVHARSAENLATRMNTQKAHSRDQVFWSMRY
jgi:pre-60S factor REI1